MARIVYKWIGFLGVVILLVLLLFPSGQILPADLTTLGNKSNGSFNIHILAWNRPQSFKRLIDSLSVTLYDGDEVNLIIHVDGGGNSTETYKISREYQWPHGQKTVIKSSVNQGLARAWFNVWIPLLPSDRAIIFEDDIVVSHLWYRWLKKAWDVYMNRTDLAGICLMRQTFIPKAPCNKRRREIINDHQPFLYKLVGSTGLSPHPVHWKKFINWIHRVDYESVDVSVPGLITTHWWKQQNRRNMWTQHFIYFCNKNKLYHLYVNLPNKTTLASNMQEAGQHYKISMGADFKLATNVSLSFPSEPNKYNWAGILWPFYEETVSTNLLKKTKMSI